MSEKLKTIRYEMPENAVIKPAGYKMLWCPKCRQEVKRIEDKRPNKMPQYICGCSNKPYRLDADVSFYSKEEPENTRRTIYQYHEAEEGVLYNKDKNVLSIYRKTDMYFSPKASKGDIVLTLPCIDRISINFNTRAVYLYCKDVGKNVMLRSDYGKIYFTYVEDEVVEFFIKKALEIAGIPVSFAIKRETRGKYEFNCDGSILKTGTPDNAYEIACALVLSPNVLIRYDKYTGKKAFRENIGTFRHDCGTMRVDPDIAKTAQFKKAQPEKLMDEGEYINLMCDTLPIPKSRAMKKLYRKNPMLMGFLASLNELGIKSIDNQKKILKSEDVSESPLIWYFRDKQFRRFIKDMVKAIGETNAVNKMLVPDIIENYGPFAEKGTYRSFRYLNDASRMYETLRKNKVGVSFTGTMKEIHDRFSESYRFITERNEIIDYSKKELEREAEYPGYRIIAAEDTDILADIGNKMHICVGSYRNIAVAKKTTIYYVLDGNNKYQACIEVVKNKLIQAKGYCNNCLTGEVAKVVDRWVKDKGLNAQNCSDYIQLQKRLTA